MSLSVYALVLPHGPAHGRGRGGDVEPRQHRRAGACSSRCSPPSGSMLGAYCRAQDRCTSTATPCPPVQTATKAPRQRGGGVDASGIENVLDHHLPDGRLSGCCWAILSSAACCISTEPPLKTRSGDHARQSGFASCCGSVGFSMGLDGSIARIHARRGARRHSRAHLRRARHAARRRGLCRCSHP